MECGEERRAFGACCIEQGEVTEEDGIKALTSGGLGKCGLCIPTTSPFEAIARHF